eukprot:TRINITY_DN42247_c1_g1_i2.p1 TRINITY_DN42247_c1_g1~~TRINITY_DN42247_c1_g1_i2.p1  ORF type:complete len:916 (+),score=196.11 TRINITY_DN42247_c1_g1_i2:185-2932(+)
MGSLERVAIVFRCQTPGTVVELQSPPDASSPSAVWMERLRSIFQPLGSEGNAFRCCVCGSLEEVASHLWQHQVLWLLLRPSGPDGHDEARTKHVAVPMMELLEPPAPGSEIFARGRYSNEVALEEESLDGSGRISVSISLEAVRDHAGSPAGLLRPSFPEAFLLTLEATPASIALVTRASRDADGAAAGGTPAVSQFGMRFGSVEQGFKESMAFTLVLVKEWAEVIQALSEMDVVVQAPTNGGSDYSELPVDLTDLMKAVADKRGGPDMVTVTARSMALPFVGEPVVFSASIQALRWTGQDQPAEPGRSKDTQLWTDGLATDGRNWRVSVELRSLRLTSCSANAFLAYMYEPFQQPRPFRTNPPVLARQNNTVNSLPHAFSSYTLAATPEDLRSELEEPLRVEIWHRDLYKKDALLGFADVGLASVFDRPLQYSQSMPSMVRGFRVLDQVCNVIGTSEASAAAGRIGALRVVLFLEDLGPAVGVSAARQPRLQEASTFVPVPLQEPVAAYPPEDGAPSAATPAAAAAAAAGTAAVAPANRDAPLLDGLNAIRSSPAYTSAYELELWKQAEQDKFRAYLLDQEKEQREKLEDEYRSKELIRSREFRQKQGELRELEAKVRKKLQDMQQREMALVAEETRVASLRDEVKRRADTTIQDFEGIAKRQVSEAQHLLQLEKASSRHLEERLAELEDDVKAARQRSRELEEELDLRRRNLEETPAAKLQLELQAAQLELQDLRQRCDALAASREHFRQKVEELCRRQIGTGAAGNATRAAGHASSAMIDGSVDCMDSPNIHYSPEAAETPPPDAAGATQGITDALRKIQTDLADLAKGWSSDQNGAHPAHSLEHAHARHTSPPPPEERQPGQVTLHLNWLRAQRRELLESGLYKELDPVLLALDDRIAEAEAKSLQARMLA